MHLDIIKEKLSDKFFTWGWQKIKPKMFVPCSLLIERYNKKSSKFKDNVIWVGHALPRYSYKISCEPVGPLFLDFINDQIKIGKSLSKSYLSKIKYRPYPYEDYGWDQVKRLKNEIPNIKVSDPTIPFQNEINNSSLILCFSNSTTFIESISSEVPTLFYQSSKHWRISKYALSNMEELK